MLVFEKKNTRTKIQSLTISLNLLVTISLQQNSYHLKIKPSISWFNYNCSILLCI